MGISGVMSPDIKIFWFQKVVGNFLTSKIPQNGALQKKNAKHKKFSSNNFFKILNRTHFGAI
jgi:hypothetical protein